jgi:hypothetical protein
MLDSLKGNKYRNRLFRNSLILIAISSMMLGCKTLNKVKDTDVTSLPTDSVTVTSIETVSGPEMNQANNLAETVLIEANYDNLTVAEKRAQIQTIIESIKIHEARIQTIDESISLREAEMDLLAEKIPHSEVISILSHSEEIPSSDSTSDGSIDSLVKNADNDSVKPNKIANYAEADKAYSAEKTIMTDASIEDAAITEKKAELLNLEKIIKDRVAQIETIDESITAREAQLLQLVDQIQIRTVEQVLRLTEENPTASGTPVN